MSAAQLDLLGAAPECTPAARRCEEHAAEQRLYALVGGKALLAIERVAAYCAPTRMYWMGLDPRTGPGLRAAVHHWRLADEFDELHWGEWIRGRCIAYCGALASEVPGPVGLSAPRCATCMVCPMERRVCAP